MRKLKNIFIICLLSTLVFGCVNNSQESSGDNTKIIQKNLPKSNDENEVNPNHSNNANIISYKNFEKLFNDMHEKFSIEGYTLKDSTVDLDLTVVDKDLTFGTREWLTVGGTNNPNNAKSTQESLFLENEDSSTLLTIILSYTDSYIGEDMIYYKIDSEYEINEDLASTTDLITVSYKNLIISILQTAKDKRDIDITQNTLRKTIEFLENY